jgi:hypothetical protein
VRCRRQLVGRYNAGVANDLTAACAMLGSDKDLALDGVLKPLLV